MTRLLTAGIALSVTLAPSGARADGCALGEEGGIGGAETGTLTCLQNDDIRMLAERVVFTEAVDDENELGAAYYNGTPLAELPWHVQAHYVFENLTPRDISLRIAFPVLGGEPEQDASFRVRVAGAEVPHSVVAGPYQFDARREVRDYIFTARFPAQAKVEMDCEYDQLPAYTWYADGAYSRSYERWELGFVLRTGATWSGTIGTVELEYRFVVPREDIDLDDDFSETLAPGTGTVTVDDSLTFDYDLSCVSGGSVLRLTAHEVEPQADVVVYSDHPGFSVWGEACPLAPGESFEDRVRGEPPEVPAPPPPR